MSIDLRLDWLLAVNHTKSCGESLASTCSAYSRSTVVQIGPGTAELTQHLFFVFCSKICNDPWERIGLHRKFRDGFVGTAGSYLIKVGATDCAYCEGAVKNSRELVSMRWYVCARENVCPQQSY